MKKAIIALVLAALCLPAAAQYMKINPKFGEVSEQELMMDTYPPDTSAAVVVLYQKQVAEASIDSGVGLMRHETFTTRFRVMKESGKSYAEYKIRYRDYGDIEEMVTDIKVVTWNMENGKKVKTVLPKKMIFREKVSERYWSVAFAAENVRVGSVVEVTFKFSSNRVGEFGTMYMQSSVPINISELEVIYAECFIFNKMQQGYEPFTHSHEVTNGYASFGQSRLDFNINNDRFRAVDVPAMRPEPFSYYPDQYRLAMDYELRQFHLVGATDQYFSTTWHDVDQSIVNDGILKEFHAKCPFKDEAVAAASSVEGEAAQIAAVRDLVRSKIKWNKRISIYPQPKKALKEGEGDSADINALVSSALINAIILSKRGNAAPRSTVDIKCGATSARSASCS